LVQLQEAENQIITHYQVYEDCRQTSGCWSQRSKHIGATGSLTQARGCGAGYYSRVSEDVVKEIGVDYISIPNRGA
jgi:hypothetical protein